jgi:hypothetical protein
MKDLYVFFLLGIFATYWVMRLRHQLYFQGLCSGLAGSFGRDENNLFYEGRYQGREYRIVYRYRLIPRNKFWPVFKSTDELEFQMPILQKFWLRLVPQRTSETNPTEIVIDVDEVDDRFVIHSNQPDAAREYLNSEVVIACLRVLALEPDRIEFHRGRATVTIAQFTQKKPHAHEIRSALDQLVRMIRIYEEQQAQVFRIAQRIATTLCPFCRCEMNSASESIVSCSTCNTNLHDLCWMENGQCTTWGCHSTSFIQQQPTLPQTRET